MCSAARALAWRWGHTADAFPLVDALRDVASVLCAEGVCSDAAELTRLDRWRQGGLAVETVSGIQRETPRPSSVDPKWGLGRSDGCV